MAAGDSGLGGSSPSGYSESFPESVAGVCCPLASGLPAGVGRSPPPARVLPPQCFLIPRIDHIKGTSLHLIFFTQR